MAVLPGCYVVRFMAVLGCYGTGSWLYWLIVRFLAVLGCYGTGPWLL